MQFLAGPQVESVDRGNDRQRHAGMQSFRHGPEAVSAVRGFDERDARGIKPETVEAVSGNMSAKSALIASAISRQDEDEGSRGSQLCQNGNDETKGGGERAFGFGNHLMQGAAGKSAAWQM